MYMYTHIYAFFHPDKALKSKSFYDIRSNRRRRAQKNSGFCHLFAKQIDPKLNLPTVILDLAALENVQEKSLRRVNGYGKH